MRIFSTFIVALALVGAAPAAVASTITYNFTTTATTGGLAGSSANGSFSYDSSSVVLGGTNNAAGLLTSLTFTWNGITYNSSNANTGWLRFDGAGDLINAALGTNCGAGVCSIASGAEQWVVALSTGFNMFVYSTPSTYGRGTASMTFAPPHVDTPEPLTLSLFVAGLVGAAARRRKAAKAS